MTETTVPTWNPSIWRDRPAAQQPPWPDAAALDAAEATLRGLPPLVFAGEARSLTAALGDVCDGRAFVLMAGDCAESFADVRADSIRDRLKVILQMAVILTYGAGVPTVKVGRIAGQYAKPRSAPTETRGDETLASFFGHCVNDEAFTPEARTPDPQRLVQAYHNSAATLNLVRALTTGGFADLSRVHAWNLEFAAGTGEGTRYELLAAEIDRALRFMAACGIDLGDEPALHATTLYTAHEALLLGYEEALTRQDSLTGDFYDCSAHLLWIGERTRQLDGAHVAFLSGVHNPLGCKIGPTATPDEVVELCATLNPDRIPGRLTLIARMGAAKVGEVLAPILAAVSAAGHPVVWACDPMHANTFKHASGYKTRNFDDVLAEVTGFFAACRAAGVWPGGLHCELTGDDVTECLGGTDAISGDDLEHRYETMCDPRLNARQSLDLAFRVADLLRG